MSLNNSKILKFPKQIVIDKSFLQSASQEVFAELLQNHILLMPQTLLYEILTTEKEKRLKCFWKIPDIDNPFVLLNKLEDVYQFEIENHKIWTICKDLYVDIPYRFGRKLKDPNFEIRQEDEKNILEWDEEINDRTNDFIELSKIAKDKFPELSNYNPGQSVVPINNAKNKIYSDYNCVLEIYSIYADLSIELYVEKPLPDKNLITLDWAVFRWLQIRLILSLDYLAKYGCDDKLSISFKNVKNDMLDGEYLFFACLFGALATTDKVMIERFKMLKPEGVLITRTH